ncbi:MAG: methyl-accepting chemotaxis protein [Bacteriovoracaceae bacterium]|jgi:methyl-accepting chemotaxis protein|nr:hypothetical protein [Halobacteriovoraceae bacterium]MDP7319012.1 methyl-accepting chemotaxis protein [Bacteriovoracaceae bacterium]
MTFKEGYIKNMNKLFIFLCIGHIPLFLGMAWFFKTEYSIAFLGPLIITLGPFVGYLANPTSSNNSILNAIAMMCLSAVMIHLGKGMIEMHFHIFIFLSFLIVFGSVKTILAALVTVAIHHISFFFLFPKSLFNYEATFGVVLLHATFAIFASVGCALIARRFGQFLSAQETIMSNLKTVVATNNELSQKIGNISKVVSESTNTQASSVQQTVSTLEQISKMVDMTNTNIQETENNTKNSFKVAEQGKDSVSSVTHSIENISDSNQKMINELEKNMSQIQEVTGLIQQIAEKTTIINDIVFQTKLLSFNASVEAARAGEHGKGFSVVAEEIGNLANMSGKASEEINSLLDNSISRVNRIVQDSNSNMAKLSVQGQKVLKEGITKSNHSIDIINKVVENMKRNSGLMNSIATASDEQSKGVNEITQAIQSINSSNQENISLINELKSLSEQMDYESKNLDQVVQHINETLIGSNKNAA